MSKRLVKGSNVRHAARFMSNNCLDPSIGLSEEEAEIQSMAMNFAQNELAPKMQEWDRDSVFPIDVIKQTGFLNIFCIRIVISERLAFIFVYLSCLLVLILLVIFL